jgi:hypothetical protein
MDLLRTKASGDDRDYVCEEIGEALRRKIVVIPVRVGRKGRLAPLPRVDELPPEILLIWIYGCGCGKDNGARANGGCDEPLGDLPDVSTVQRLID